MKQALFLIVCGLSLVQTLQAKTIVYLEGDKLRAAIKTFSNGLTTYQIDTGVSDFKIADEFVAYIKGDELRYATNVDDGAHSANVLVDTKVKSFKTGRGVLLYEKDGELRAYTYNNAYPYTQTLSKAVKKYQIVE